jgi:predicted transport protein
MADNPLVKKLGIKPGQRALVLNAPPGYTTQLDPLPEGVTLAHTPDGSYDFVQLFVKNQAELAEHIPTAIQLLKPGGLFWIAYPKLSSKIATDLTRDVGWDAVYNAGLEGVSLVSIDAVWTAMRFKPGAPPVEDPLAAQYAGPKAALRPIYDRLAALAQQLGGDVTLDPRKTYVSLARQRQFGVIQPSTRTRVDLGLKLPGVAPTDRLLAAGGFGSGNVTHRVALASLDDIDDQLIGWIRSAYESVR